MNTTYYWLAKWFERKERERQGGCDEDHDSSDEDVSRTIDPDRHPDDEFFLERDVLDDILKTIAMRKDANETSAIYDLKDFKVEPRMPNAERRAKIGSNIDGVRSKPCTTTGTEFAHAFLKTSTVTLSTMTYDQRDAEMFCRMWAHRCQYFCDQWKLDKCSLSFEYTEDMVESYQMHPDFLEFLTGLGETHPIRDRLAQLHNTKPSPRANLKKLFALRNRK